MQEHTVSTTDNSIRDVAILVKEKLTSRTRKIRQALMWSYLFLATIMFTALVVIGSYVNYEFAKPTRFKTDYRECSYVDKKAGIEIRGRREFSYQERSFLGVNIRFDRDVREKTTVELSGKAITAVGISPTGWWYIIAGQGERGFIELKSADHYVFTLEKGAASISHDQFCQ